MSDHDEQQVAPDAHADHDFTGPLSAPVRRLLRVFFVLSALLLLADFVVDRKVHQPAEKMPGFYAVYGFIGCVILVLAAKELRKAVMRPESYYDPRDDDTAGGDDA